MYLEIWIKNNKNAFSLPLVIDIFSHANPKATIVQVNMHLLPFALFKKNKK